MHEVQAVKRRAPMKAFDDDFRRTRYLPENQLQPFSPAKGGEIALGRGVADDNHARVSWSMVLRSDSSSSTVVPGHARCAERKSSDSQRAE